jgi:hypothetical protein
MVFYDDRRQRSGAHRVDKCRDFTVNMLWGHVGFEFDFPEM